jgi:hypothetical protein
MQISRHWRMNGQRYRLQGVRYANGEVSLQARPQLCQEEIRNDVRDTQAREKVTVKV